MNSTFKTKYSIRYRIVLLMVVFLLPTFLTACQGQEKNLVDSYWKSAAKADSLADYIKENADTLDVEALREEIDSAETTLSRQFEATALLCSLEYWQNAAANDSLSSAYDGLSGQDKDDLFRYEYPDSSTYAESFLAKVLTEGEEFWESLDNSFYPHDCILPMFAAAEQLDGKTLAALTDGIPTEARYDSKLKSAIDKWIEKNPEKLSAINDDLTSSGYFDDWTLSDWKDTYLYSYTNDNPVQTDTIEDGITYISYLRDSMLPALGNKFGADELKDLSDITEEDYYSTKLTIAIGEELSLKEPDENSLPETIETEGKKVIAFYRNPLKEEFAGSPASLRILGDFMLNLPDEEYPSSMDEADYYLVLTPSYEYGSFYQDRYSGSESKFQEVYSYTSIDLYEAGTGTFLRHLGTVMEEASSSIVTSYSDDPLQYPELTPSDILSYIYHNVNTPDAYLSLVDRTEGRTEFERDESVILGGWEITYHSGQITDSFDDKLMHYTASDGCQLIRASFTVTNVGLQDATFLPESSSVSSENLNVLFTDSTFENVYESTKIWTYLQCLNSTGLEQGESVDGELIFEVPDEVIQGAEAFYIIILRGYQMVIYPFAE